MSIKENWEGIKQATSNLIETVKPHFEQFKQSFAGLWAACQSIYTTVIQPLFQIVGEVIEECIYFVTPLIQGLLTVFSIVFDAIAGVWFGVGQPNFCSSNANYQEIMGYSSTDFKKPIIFILISVLSHKQCLE